MRPGEHRSAAEERSPSATAGSVRLRHGRVELALHELRPGDGPTLLVLHGLGESASMVLPPEVLHSWPGAVWGLDFTGHGASTVPLGGGYSSEILMADADAALHHLGLCTILGYGLGGYIGLLIAGARPDGVHGVIIADGPGLIGGGTRPGNESIEVPFGWAEGSATPATPDPFALAELAHDIRPTDYALSFVHTALQGSGLDTPVSVAAVSRPQWLAAVVAEFGVAELTVAEALTTYAR